MEREVFATGAPVWLDLSSSDVVAARAFYGGVFGWEFSGEGTALDGYLVARLRGKQVAGLMQHDEVDGEIDAWAVYLASADVDALAARAVAQGGTVLSAPMDVPGMGRFAWLTDAAGGEVGVWQGGGLRGYELVDEPGAPAWSELYVRDFAGAREFYTAVFEWDVETLADSPTFRYARHVAGGVPQAGLMEATSFLPDDVNSWWRTYFRVEDVVDAIDTVERLGGTMLTEPDETPYGVTAEVADPCGARLTVVSGGPPPLD